MRWLPCRRLPEAELQDLGRRARRVFAEMDEAADAADAEADAGRAAGDGDQEK